MSRKTTKASLTEAQVASVHRLLLRKFHDAGRGTLTRVETRLGLPAGYFAYHRRVGTLDVGVLLDALQLLGIDPRAFFVEALAEARQIGEIVGDDPPPEIVKVMQAIVEEDVAGATELPPGLAAEPAAEGPSSGLGPVVSREWLGEMDELRYQDPRQAHQLLLEAPVTVELAPEYLGVCGSVRRVLVQLSQARRCLRLGLFLARQRGDSPTEARMLQRLSSVWGAAGQFQRGLEVAQSATGLYSRLGDQEAVGKTLYDQAKFLWYLNRPKEAADALSRAEPLLQNAPKSLFATLHVLATCARDEGDLEKAGHLLRRAGALPGINRSSIAKATWLQASLEMRKRRFDSAETLLVRAVEVLRQIELDDFALATVHLIWVQIVKGQYGEAWARALDARFLVVELEDNPIVASAVMQLIRGGRSALTAALAERVGRELEEKLGTPWRAFPAAR